MERNQTKHIKCICNLITCEYLLLEATSWLGLQAIFLWLASYLDNLFWDGDNQEVPRILNAKDLLEIGTCEHFYRLCILYTNAVEP